MNTRWLALLLLGVISACGHAPPAQAPGSTGVCRNASLTNPLALAPGLGGSGAPVPRGPDPGGIGGTGQVAQGSNGLGGTGAPALAQEGSGLGGTGIVGVVTGFASICVNGEEVEYTPETPVQRDGEGARLEELAVGQLVALVASGPDGRLTATRIAVLDAAVGPLSSVDAANGRFELLGQRGVALEKADLETLRPGDWVRVSGQRLPAGEIRATRVMATSPGTARLTALVTRLDAAGLVVGGTPVRTGALALPQGLVVGMEVHVHGDWDGQVLRARNLQPRPTLAALGEVREQVLQGYVHSVRGRELQLGYQSLVLGRDVQVKGGRLDALQVGQPVVVRGHLDERQRLNVDSLEFRNEIRRGRGGRGSTNDSVAKTDDSADDSSDSARSGSGSDSDSGKGRGRGRGRGGDDGGGSNSGSGSSGSNSGSGSSGSGSSGSGSSGSGSSGSGSSGSGSSGSGSSGSGTSGSGSSGSGTSGSGSSNSGSSGSSSGSGGSDSGGKGRGRGRGGKD